MGNTRMLDDIKQTIEIVVELVRSGESPNELITMYQELGPEHFTYWLHGYFCNGKLRVCWPKVHRFLLAELLDTNKSINLSDL